MPAESIVYLNGQFVPRSQAHLDIDDRGTLFADGVYEVVRYWNGVGLALDAHVQRLHRSCTAIDIAIADDLTRIGDLSNEVVRRNGLRDAGVYWQVTRGVAPRRHAYPPGLTPTMLVAASPGEPLDPQATIRQAAAILHPDERWSQCWIKSLMLLPNVLAKTRAVRAGADEAILHRHGRITEGTSTTVCVVRDGALWTHPLDGSILPSVTRQIVLELGRGDGLPIREEAYPTAELDAAQEVMILSTTTMATAITRVDGRAIGDGAAGPVARRLHRLLLDRVVAECHP